MLEVMLTPLPASLAGVVTVTVENAGDCWDVEAGRLPPDRVRRAEVINARLVPERAGLSLPAGMIHSLGLVVTGGGPPRYGPVRLTFGDQSSTLDADLIPDGQPVAVGRVALAQLGYEMIVTPA